jgi:hypothetical protein
MATIHWVILSSNLLKLGGKSTMSDVRHYVSERRELSHSRRSMQTEKNSTGMLKSSVYKLWNWPDQAHKLTRLFSCVKIVMLQIYESRDVRHVKVNWQYWDLVTLTGRIFKTITAIIFCFCIMIEHGIKVLKMHSDIQKLKLYFRLWCPLFVRSFWHKVTLHFKFLKHTELSYQE